MGKQLHSLKRGSGSIERRPLHGITRIAAERRRQISELGYTREEDQRRYADTVGQNSLLLAAIVYAYYGLQQRAGMLLDREWFNEHWPWTPATFQPEEDTRDNLAKAGALLAAQIDLDNATLPPVCEICGDSDNMTKQADGTGWVCGASHQRHDVSTEPDLQKAWESGRSLTVTQDRDQMARERVTDPRTSDYDRIFWAAYLTKA